MAAKSNYFKESVFDTWHFHSVGKENRLLRLRLAARGVLHLQSPAMRPVVRVLPKFAVLLVSSAFAQQPIPILPDSFPNGVSCGASLSGMTRSPATSSPWSSWPQDTCLCPSYRKLSF